MDWAAALPRTYGLGHIRQRFKKRDATIRKNCRIIAIAARLFTELEAIAESPFFDPEISI
jgi:hypothetical protein